MPTALPDTLPATMPPHVRAALAEAKVRLTELYGERLDRLVLYGSHARGDARDDSDVDLLVVLRGEVNALAEIRHLAPFSLDLLGRYGALVSVHPLARRGYDDRTRTFTNTVRAEGVVL